MTDDAVASPDIAALAAGYVRYAEALGEGAPLRGPGMAAASAHYDAVDALVRSGPAADAWAAVLAVVRRAPDARLDVYAAGPLEDLVRRHGVVLVDEIEREAANDERLRRALGCIWLTVDDLTPAVLTRLVAASGGALRPLGPDSNDQHLEAAI